MRSRLGWGLMQEQTEADAGAQSRIFLERQQNLVEV